MLSVHSFSLVFLQRQVAKLVSGLYCRWSLLRNNNMATNLQRFTSNYGRKEGVLPHVAVEHRHLGGHCSEAVTGDSGRARSFILCEEKHEWICSNFSTGLQNPFLVWDGECEQCAWTERTAKSNYFMQASFHQWRNSRAGSPNCGPRAKCAPRNHFNWLQRHFAILKTNIFTKNLLIW